MLCSATVQMRKTHYCHKIKDIFRIYVRADGCSVLKEILTRYQLLIILKY